MPYEEVIILCFRTSNPDVLIVPGTSKSKCEKCQYDVWIAPSSLKLREKMNAKIICDVCETLKPKPGSKLDILPLNNEQLEEIKDGLWNRKTRN